MSERTALDMWVDPKEDPREAGEKPVGERDLRPDPVGSTALRRFALTY
jgi:hypothetical protein